MRRFVLALLFGLGLCTLGQGCALERYGSGERNAGRPTEAGAGGGTAGNGSAGEAGAGTGGAGAGGAGAGGAGAGGGGAAGQSGGGGAGAMSGSAGAGATSGSAGAGATSGSGGAGAGGAGAGGASGQGGDAGQAGAGGAQAGAGGAGGAGAGGAGGGGAGGAGQGGSGGAGCVLFADPCDADCDGHLRADPVACPGGDDCCDSDGDVFPGQTKWFTVQSACSSFDYDCNTKEDQRTGQGSKCVGCNFFDCCHTPGYEGTPPACGQSGPTTGCKAFCAEADTSQVQECH